MSSIQGSGLQTAANALRNVDLGDNATDLLDQKVRQMTGLASAGAQSAVVKAQDQMLGTILDLKA